MKILIDSGHGQNTPGKCSPVMKDGTRYYEYAYARIVANEIVDALRKDGFDATLLTPELNDTPLTTRVNRVNDYCKQYGKDNVIVVSIHSNAAGNGGWTNARGWSVYTSRGQTKSDILATCIYNAMEKSLADSGYNDTFTASDKKQKPMRNDFSDGDCDYEEGFYILRKTMCAAVLTENLFHDNEADVCFLNSDKGRQAIVKGHVEGIKDYIKIAAK